MTATQRPNPKEQPHVIIEPGSTLGVLGGGQLGRMFVEQARRMGYEVIVLDPDPQSPAGSMATAQICAPYDDPKACRELASKCAAITCEFENVPAATLEQLAQSGARLAPRPMALEVAQHRAKEKSQIQKAGFSVVPYLRIEAGATQLPALDGIAFPAILKSAQLGYDGKGQRMVQSAQELEAAYKDLGRVDCVLEQRLDLKTEVSVVVIRGYDGRASTFPCIENRHRNGILDLSVVPAQILDRVEQEARHAALTLAHHLKYVGVLTVEFFVDAQDRLYINEMAPRPHNSGHLSINASPCSQFEHQLRALCALPAGPCEFEGHAAMINLLGDLWQSAAPEFAVCLQVPGTSLHLYGKKSPRPGRKMGHLTVLAKDRQSLHARIARLRKMLSLPEIEGIG